MGRGTFGKVKLGTHTSTNEKVSIPVESHSTLTLLDFKLIGARRSVQY